MNTRLIAAIFLAIVLLFGLNWAISGNVLNGKRIKVSGNIEVTEVEVSFEIPGRVQERLVDEGEFIKQGQVVAVLDIRALEQEVGMRKAAVAASEAVLAELISGYLPEEISQAEAQLEQTKAELERLQSEYDRQKNLFQTNVISQKEFDTSTALYQVATAKNVEAKEKLTLLENGIRIEKIDQARAKLNEAKESLALSETKLSYATLKAPIEGWVLSKNIESGEVVVAGTPIVSVGNLNDIWLRAYINETNLGQVKLGQKVEVTTNSYPGKIYEGRIIFISSEAEFTPKNVQTEKERVKLVYRIKVKLNNAHQELKPGMPADGVINIE